jgi:hypothetical protein
VEKELGAKFSTRLMSAFIHGIFIFVLLFFAGLLIEGAIFMLGANDYYNIVKGEIPTLMGAIGFFNSIAYEFSRLIDQEEAKA